ncbi:MFS transporter [Streptomyces sp. 796.1]|uniref:MFS transporter n=1 Tax=Streptomyces sp. 796.1 TaxID=3163029 RepID=UPI0039C912B4
MKARVRFLDTRPLRGSRAFRELWIGTSASQIGAQLATVAVLAQVWELTGSPVGTGAIGLATGLPMIVFGLVGGVLADAVDRRTVVRATTFGQLLAAFALAAQALAGNRSVLLLLVLVAAESACAALGAPARRTFPVRLLPADQVAAGLALANVSFQAAMLAGPALAGVVIAQWGLSAAYAVQAGAVVVALLAVFRLPSMPPVRPAGGGAGAAVGGAAGAEARAGAGGGEGTGPEAAAGVDVSAATAAATTTSEATATGAARRWRPERGGWRVLWRRPVLWGCLATDLAATLLAMPIALFPLVNEERFGGNPRTLGLFLSAVAVGGIVAGLLSGTVTRWRRSGLVQLTAAGVWGLALAGFGLAGPLWLALGLLAVAGAADTVSVVTRSTVVQLETPDAYRGRVSSAEHVIGVAGPHLGNFRGGVVASATSAPFSLVTGGLLATFAIAAVAAANAPLRGYRTPAAAPDEAATGAVGAVGATGTAETVGTQQVAGAAGAAGAGSADGAPPAPDPCPTEAT